MSEGDLCRTLRTTIGAAQRAIADGAFVDLAGFDREVATLCAAVERLAEPARSAICDDLTGLLADLEELTAALTAQNLQSADGDAARQRAARAYGPGKAD